MIFKKELNQLLDLFPNMDFSWSTIPEITKVLEKLNGNWRFVGGCVRDSLLGIKTYDIDINTELSPDQVEDCLKDFNINTIGKRFGTIGVFIKNWKIEITTNRSDIKTYGRAADVAFNVSFEDDASRRDFTMNAIMYKDGYLYDYHNGISDLYNKTVIFIGDPEQRIIEDYLRILRYIRFFVRYDSGEPKYNEIFVKHLDGLKNVSMERIISEIEKICSHNRYYEGLSIINKCAIDETVFGKSLFFVENDELTVEERVALLFYFFDKKEIQKLPLNKDIRRLILQKEKKSDDIIEVITDIWISTQNQDLAKSYLKIYFKIYPEIKNKFLTNLIEKIWEMPKIDLNQYVGTERGRAIKITKYLYLKQNSCTFEEIESFMKTKKFLT